MKNTNILLALFLIVSLLGATFAAAIETGDILVSTEDVSDITSIDDSITASDITSSDTDLGKVSYTKKTVSMGSGWITTSGKGSLLSIHLVNGYVEDKTLNSKGWIKAGDLKLKLDSTEITENSKTFDVTARDGSIKGTLTLKKTDQTYQKGFGIWNGDLKLTLKDGTAIEAKVSLALEEKQVRKQNSDGKYPSSYVGSMELGGQSFDLEGSSNKLQILEFKLKGQNGAIGKLVLESKDSTNYVGKIKVQETNGISGKVTATLKREGNTLYGPIRVELDGSAATDLASLEGNIKIALSESSAFDDSKDKNRKVDSNSDSFESEDKQNVESDRGFWKKFFNFFGGN